MPAPINPFKKALGEGQTLFGCWMSIGDGYTAEILGRAGFDWLLIDGEHAPNDIRSIRDQVLALESSASHAIVRLPIGETWLIKQVLDLGVQTVLVPIVETKEQASELVSACRYPPAGTRGVGYGVSRAGGFGQYENYGPTADDQICLLVQVVSIIMSKREIKNSSEENIKPPLKSIMKLLLMELTPPRLQSIWVKLFCIATG